MEAWEALVPGVERLRPVADEFRRRGAAPQGVPRKDVDKVHPPVVIPIGKSAMGLGPNASRHMCKSLRDAGGGAMILIAAASKGDPNLPATTWSACVLAVDQAGRMAVKGIKGSEYVRAIEALAADLGGGKKLEAVVAEARVAAAGMDQSPDVPGGALGRSCGRGWRRGRC